MRVNRRPEPRRRVKKKPRPNRPTVVLPPASELVVLAVETHEQAVVTALFQAHLNSGWDPNDCLDLLLCPIGVRYLRAYGLA